MFNRLSLPANTLFAELLGQVRYLEAKRELGSQRGSVGKKFIKGTWQYYYRFYDFRQKRREYHIGGDNEQTRDFITKFQNGLQQKLNELAATSELTKMFVAGGGIVTDRSTYSVIEALVNQGFFRAGGVLVGTQAFIALCNLLGINPTGVGMKTHDIDVVSEKRVVVASGQTIIPIEKTLERLGMGFVPVPSLNHKNPATSYRSESGISVEFSTPMIGKHKDGVVNIAAFGVHAQPIRYLDYLIEKTTEAVVISRNKATHVLVPDPSHFACHKLIVAAKRSLVDHTKIAKDIAQAAIFFEYLLDERPDDLELAYANLKSRGIGWVANLGKGLEKLARANPDLGEKIKTNFLA